MNLIIKTSAEEDLDNLKNKETKTRIFKKIQEIQQKIEQGFKPDRVIEKRLSSPWSPMLQQRVGQHRVWFVKGSETQKGKQDTVYCIRILEKEQAKKLQGVDINPDTYL